MVWLEKQNVTPPADADGCSCLTSDHRCLSIAGLLTVYHLSKCVGRAKTVAERASSASQVSKIPNVSPKEGCQPVEGMSDKLKLMVQGLLRPSEVVIAAIEAYISPKIESTLETTSPTKVDETGRARIVAVVAHLDPQANTRDQIGCVLILKVSLSSTSSKTDSAFEHAFPITDGLSISMSQAPLHELDPIQSSVMRTALALSIATDKDPAAEQLTLLTRDSEGLKLLLDEYRRCKVASSLVGNQRGHSWLEPYIGRPSRPAILSTIPPDLRMLQKPVHTLLSPASAGLPGDEALDIAIIREDWSGALVSGIDFLSAFLRRCLIRVSSGNSIRVGTFNVNGKMPTQDLSSWLRDGGIYGQFIPPLKEISPLSLSDLSQSPLSTGDGSSTGPDAGDSARAAESQGDPDLLVLAFQELDLSTEALLYSSKTVREDAWCAAVLAGLGDKAVLYEKLVSKQLVGMLLLVLVRKRLKERFSDVRSASVGAGIMGMMGNKGATAVRMAYAPPSEDGVASRPTTLTFVNSHLAAFDEMFDRRNADFHDICKRLSFESGASIPEGSAQNDDPSVNNALALNVFETDAIFWTLILAQQSRRAFEDFNEHQITHLPRKPAWTDRILHMNSAMVDIEQISYTSHPDISMSDHRPVSAEFDVRVAALDGPAFEAYVHDLWRDIGSFAESEEVPRMRVNTTFIDFGPFTCRNSVQRSLQVQNIGKIPCAYRFVAAKTGSDTREPPTISASWLGLLLPGECMAVKMSTRIDTTLATKLNSSETRLEHTLILHTALGKDHFVTVVAKYGPIRALTSSNELLAADHARTAPREIMRMINWLMTNATDVEELFLQAGDRQLVDTICECLDTGMEFPFQQPETEPASALAFGDAFIRFLRLLPEPIIPASLITRCAEVTSKEDAFELLEELPAVNLNVWISTTAVLHFIAQQAASATRVEQLVAVFTSVLLPDDPMVVASPSVSILGKRTFLRYFIL
ncbi:DNase I-like protein [Daedalea quercina L-15889]|uniref:DNase I-like protein n=1 Tax=Daedalea quercina L-15889 TaxID=1314783 RepID=A0A165LC07_9APHY|nr:DNase I-like protein [Daedalea quercina L-15889]